MNVSRIRDLVYRGASQNSLRINLHVRDYAIDCTVWAGMIGLQLCGYRQEEAYHLSKNNVDWNPVVIGKNLLEHRGQQGDRIVREDSHRPWEQSPPALGPIAWT
jgi:hypothetical protein